MPQPLQPYDFDLVYRDHVQRVARWAARLLGASSDVDDVVQEVFLTAHRLLPGFRGEAAISTWLFTLTTNAVRVHGRRAGRWRDLQHRAQLLQAAAQGHASDPEAQLERQRDLALAREALEAMSEKYRTLLVLFRLEGLSGEELAARSGLPVATVWVRLHRARAQFAAEVERRAARPVRMA
jgi:RNA polymerase sigma-70 factor (ECF subfamily)